MKPVEEYQSLASTRASQVTHPSTPQKGTDEASIDVLCTNCYECVPLNTVDIHSEYCTNPTAEEAVDARINKLASAIHAKTSTSSGPEIIMLTKLEQFAYASLNPANDINSILAFIAELQTESPSFGCSICARRLIRLIEMKACEGIDSDVPSPLDRWKARAGFLLQLSTCPQAISDLHSEVSSDSGSIFSSFSDFPSYRIRDLRTTLPTSSDDREKYFFSLCIQRKASLEKTSLSQDIPISEVYEKVLRDQVPFESWENYIEQVFCN